MALHSLSEAARISGKSRSTIHRHIKEGKLSKVLGDDGKPAVETSELHRVYGSLSQSVPQPHTKVFQDETYETPAWRGDAETLTIQLQALERERDSLKEERDRWAAQAERLTLLLTNVEPPKTSANAPSTQRRGLWLDKMNRWLGRV